MDGSLKTWRKGGGTLYAKTKGRAAHAGGDHQNGRNAIEEMLRLVTPVHSFGRTVLKDTELRGRKLKAGQIVKVKVMLSRPYANLY